MNSDKEVKNAITYYLKQEVKPNFIESNLVLIVLFIYSIRENPYRQTKKL